MFIRRLEINVCKTKLKVLFLVGPTAVGKSRVSLVLAERIGAEIISLDSMQLYKGFDIISSKPSLKDMSLVRHHLIDILSPSRSFDVSQYRRLAVKKIRKIHGRGKTPLFAGGTGLYMSVLLDGIFKEPGFGKGIREKLLRSGQKKGHAFLHAKLKKADPESAARIHPNDSRRIIRALEVYEKTGKPISSWQKERKGIWVECDVRIIGLNMEREALYARINRRVDEMVYSGLVEEARGLLTGRLSKTAKSAIGIPELKGCFAGEYDIKQAVDLIKMNTRRYAKRQLTYFRRDKRIQWVMAGENQSAESLARDVMRRIG